jgi:hypothetical protein
MKASNKAPHDDEAAFIDQFEGSGAPIRNELTPARRRRFLEMARATNDQRAGSLPPLRGKVASRSDDGVAEEGASRAD